MTLIASAGNKTTNVDAEDCFLACWEEAWWTPCENAGVICVGALARDSDEARGLHELGQAPTGQVEIFAPGTVLVGLDPATPSSFRPSGVHAVSGTSFAAPYLAGVVALVRAADPRLSRSSDAERIVLETARTSTDKDVGKYVNTLAAVRRALPRLVNIEAPRDGDSIGKGIAVELSAFATDPADWLPHDQLVDRQRAAELGHGATINATLPYGTHRIRARATLRQRRRLRDRRGHGDDHERPAGRAHPPAHRGRDVRAGRAGPDAGGRRGHQPARVRPAACATSSWRGSSTAPGRPSAPGRGRRST